MTKCEWDIDLKAIWEIEEVNSNTSYNNMTQEEMSVVEHFKDHHIKLGIAEPAPATDVDKPSSGAQAKQHYNQTPSNVQCLCQNSHWHLHEWHTGSVASYSILANLFFFCVD